jgi:DNA-binding CsgD family transcriptional regulator
LPELVIDQSRRCVYLNELEMQLSPQEYRVLYYLGQRPEEVVPKNELRGAMWAATDAEFARTTSFDPMAIDLVIFRLRKKLGDNAQHPIYLETRRGFGYILHYARIIHSEARRASDQAVDPLLDQTRLAAPQLAAPSGEAETAPPWSTLTRREWAIFLLLGDEQTLRLTDKALAQQLQLAESTLKKHLQHIYRKLAVENRSGAAFLAMRVKGQLLSNNRCK